MASIYSRDVIMSLRASCILADNKVQVWPCWLMGWRRGHRLSEYRANGLLTLTLAQ